MALNASRDNFPSSYSASASTSNDAKRRSAALQGASQAFFQSSSKDIALSRTNKGTNGTLATGSTARQKGEIPSPNEVHLKGGESTRLSVKTSQTFGVPGRGNTTRQSSQSREQSPSHVAALLATSRASRTTPDRESSPFSPPNPRSQRPSPLHSMEDLRSDHFTQMTAVADTASLVNLFESKQKAQNATPLTHSVRYVTKPKPMPAVVTPTPSRQLMRSASSATASGANVMTAPGRGRGYTMTYKKTSPAGAATAATDLTVPPRGATQNVRYPDTSSQQVSKPPFPPETRKLPSLDGLQELNAPSQTPRRRSPVPKGSTVELTELFLKNVTLDLQSRGDRSPTRPNLLTRRSEPAILPSTPSSTLAVRPSLLSQQISAHEMSDPVRSGRKTTRASDSYVPQLTVDSLANAMVASSLASSRAPSPSKPPPLPPPRRHGKHSLFHHQSQEDSRAPSPAKGMRQTMRETVRSDDEEDDRKHRNHRVRKHPNKHHEGDRKRYRDQVNERERKRYEGVWAANRGILLNPDFSYAVVNVVVRDIWKRSRLSDDVLEEVWDLVDTQGIGKLERDEFVVGMFLIDQRLKGNKLPFKVSESIWSSVRRLTGVNVVRDRR